MKKTVLLIAISLAAFSCKNETQATKTQVEDIKEEIAYASFGEQINDNDVLSPELMMNHYKDLKIGDTINTKMRANIAEVCTKKGCWMTLDMDGDDKVMVKFKDYGFFMPLNAEGEVVVDGKAYVSETSVDELRHYAEDAGKSEEEIAAITDPKFQYHFEAHGVLLKQ